jgi:hypothetical protein
MPWSTPDLSEITMVLKGLLDNAIQQSSLGVGIVTSCDSPETARNTGSQCQLTLYMLHVGRDPYWRNTPVSGPRPQLNSNQPLSLNLSYLLTAYCEKNFVLEQRAMSIALQAIQSNPIMTQAVIQSDLTFEPLPPLPPPPWLPNAEFVISIEADTIEEMSRLWQAFTVPIRLSALIRASVIFVGPDPLPITPPAVPPSVANLSIAPKPVPTATVPSLVPGLAQASPPVPPGADPSQVTATFGPLIAVGGSLLATVAGGSLPASVVDGSTLVIAGYGLDLASAASVFLSVPGTTTEWEVTNPWRQGVTPNELDLLLPVGYAAPGSVPPVPATETPLPGLYNLCVGSGASGSVGSTRSNPIPLAIAPRVDGVMDPPLLAPTAGIYAITGGGFVPTAATTISIGATALTFTNAATPGAGQFNVNGAGTAISFMVPSGTASGSYPVLLAVNGVAASTGWVVVL